MPEFIPAKKSLGQNFLKNTTIAALMAEIGAKDVDTVVEIGPGKGVLTEKLLEKGIPVVAIEKDRRMIPLLEEKFRKDLDSGLLSILEQDILEWETPKNLNTYSIVANIPYYITGAVVRVFLSAKNQPCSMTMLVQKEVAERIAKTKKESILSISVKVYGSPRYIKTVSRGNFAPVPNVDSAILHISDISKKNFKNIDETLFFELLKAGFGQKRKKLISNLKAVSKNVSLETIWRELDLDLNVRAEDISLETWLALAKRIHEVS